MRLKHGNSFDSHRITQRGRLFPAVLPGSFMVRAP